MTSSTSTKLILTVLAVVLTFLSAFSTAFARPLRHRSHARAADSAASHGNALPMRAMRRRVLSTARLRVNSGAAAPHLSGAFPHPRSRYVALIDASSGSLLYAINPNTPRPPASLTKIMAATILLENGKLSDTVVAPPEVVGVPESSLHLRPGEHIDLEDLLYAMLLRSANDTPVAGATYLCGNIPRFVGLMNQKAQEIGCSHTHFVTANGLYSPGHYSSAYDLALMARYALINFPMFDRIVKTQRWRVHRSIDQNDTVVINTASSFLKRFPGADGIKTGYISQSGHCFVGSATRNGFRLIAVALDSPNCREDVMQTLSYGFAHFAPMAAVPKGALEGMVYVPGLVVGVPVITAHHLNMVVSKGHPLATPPALSASTAALPLADIAMPIHAGEIVGTLTLSCGGKSVGTTELAAATNIPLSALISRGGLGRIPPMSGRIVGTILAIAVAAILAVLSVLKLYAGPSAKDTRRRGARLPA